MSCYMLGLLPTETQGHSGSNEWNAPLWSISSAVALSKKEPDKLSQMQCAMEIRPVAKCQHPEQPEWMMMEQIYSRARASPDNFQTSTSQPSQDQPQWLDLQSQGELAEYPHDAH